MSRPMYQIADSFLVLVASFEDCDEIDLPALLAKFEALEGELADKIAATIAYVREEQALATGAREEAARLLALAKVRENKIERVRDLVRYVLETTGRKRIDSKLGPARIVGNGGKRPLIVDEALQIETLPADCVRTSVELARDAIRERLERGEEIAGARLGERGSHVELG